MAPPNYARCPPGRNRPFEKTYMNSTDGVQTSKRQDPQSKMGLLGQMSSTTTILINGLLLLAAYQHHETSDDPDNRITEAQQCLLNRLIWFYSHFTKIGSFSRRLYFQKHFSVVRRMRNRVQSSLPAAMQRNVA